MTDSTGGPLGRLRSAERFAEAVDGARDATGSHAGLLELTDRLRLVPQHSADEVAMPAEAAQDLRDRLMREADRALVATDARLVLAPAARTERRARRMTAAAAALVLIGGTAGVAVAAQDSLTGEPLYAVKRGVEALTTTVSISNAARGRAYLHQADTRLDEVERLGGGAQNQARVRRTLDSFLGSAAHGSDLLFTNYQANADNADVTQVRDFATQAMGELQASARTAGPASQDEFSEAAALLTDIDQQARVLCAACGDQEPLTLPNDLEPASSQHALDDLLDDGSQPTASSPAAQVDRTLESGASAPTASPSKSAVPSQAQSSSSPLTQASSSLTQASRSVSDATRSAGVPDLVRLPGSQSGAPSVINLDQPVSKLTQTVKSTTKSLTSGAAKTGSKSKSKSKTKSKGTVRAPSTKRTGDADDTSGRGLLPGS